jgi:hypothetical protein
MPIAWVNVFFNWILRNQFPLVIVRLAVSRTKLLELITAKFKVVWQAKHGQSFFRIYVDQIHEANLNHHSCLE